MGKVKEIKDNYDYSDDYTDEQIQLKMNVEHQYYVNLYEKDIQEELNYLEHENNG